MKALIEAIYLGLEDGEFKDRDSGKVNYYTRAAFLQGLDIKKLYVHDDAKFDIRQIPVNSKVVVTLDITTRSDKTYQSLVDVEEGELFIQPPLVGKVTPEPAAPASQEETSPSEGSPESKKSGRK